MIRSYIQADSFEVGHQRERGESERREERGEMQRVERGEGQEKEREH